MPLCYICIYKYIYIYTYYIYAIIYLFNIVFRYKYIYIYYTIIYCLTTCIFAYFHIYILFYILRAYSIFKHKSQWNNLNKKTASNNYFPILFLRNWDSTPQKNWPLTNKNQKKKQTKQNQQKLSQLQNIHPPNKGWCLYLATNSRFKHFFRCWLVCALP